jgi:hypothetical protein
MNPESPNETRSSKAKTTKKPILKKRSLSEVMLQRSLSTSSLIKQAAAVIQSQKQTEASYNNSRPNIARGASDFTAYRFLTDSSVNRTSSTIPSSVSSELDSPISYRKHIHFNDTVDQFIALEIDNAEQDDEEYYNRNNDSDDDGLILMKPSARRKRKTKPRSRSSSSLETKTIAMLPSTSLNDQQASAQPTADRHSKAVSPSPSLETIRPARGSASGSGFFTQDPEEDETITSWHPSPPASTPIFGSSEALGRLGDSESSSRNGMAGLRKTASGMFMPYESDEEEAINAGLLGKVVDTVNTAKDIAHVIWNVGWRK